LILEKFPENNPTCREKNHKDYYNIFTIPHR
jgi:hypothetical protein